MKKKPKTKEKITLYEYDCQLYPRRLWIAITTGCPQGLNGIEPMSEIGIADTQTTYNEANRMGGVLIRFSTKACMTPMMMAHEAVHAAVDICDYIGGQINLESQEYFAYLVGWIVECCDDVKKSTKK